ncbi:MAG: Fic family protein [Candidatus Omnitrophota bacterium]|jgi:Fic family protein
MQVIISFITKFIILIEPQPNDFGSFDLRKIMDQIGTNAYTKLLYKTHGESYIYWDKFKHICDLQNISKEEAWMYIKLVRASNSKMIPLLDTRGKNFKYWIPDVLLKGFHYIDQKAAGTISVENPAVPAKEKDRFMISSLMEEAIASSQIEGAATTRTVAKKMLRDGRRPKDESEQMILNNYTAILKIKKLTNEPLSIEILNLIQSELTKNTLKNSDAYGRFRTNDEAERIKVWDDQTGELLHDPPAADELEKRIRLLCDYANNDQEYEFTHPVLKGMILHFWLAYNHPYVDGNGRTARALFYWYMLKKGYWMTEFISISRVMKQHIDQYKKAFLYSEHDNEDITYFLSFHTKCVKKAFDQLFDYIKRKTIELDESMKLLAIYPGINRRQANLLHRALVKPNPVYTIESHMNAYGIAYETSRTDLMDLHNKGFVEKVLQGKSFIYIPSERLSSKLKINK